MMMLTTLTPTTLVIHHLHPTQQPQPAFPPSTASFLSAGELDASQLRKQEIKRARELQNKARWFGRSACALRSLMWACRQRCSF
jgi:hypothetical protein